VYLGEVKFNARQVERVKTNVADKCAVKRWWLRSEWHRPASCIDEAAAMYVGLP
jgi:hypothetical protein